MKWETFPSLICLMNQKVKTIVNEKYCPIFLFFETFYILPSWFTFSTFLVAMESELQYCGIKAVHKMVV